MVRIRLRRVGRKKQPSYRIVVADQRSPRDGRYIEVIGFYNPRTEPATMRIDEARALHWLSVGAQPSEAVQRILNKLGTQGRFERLRQGEDLEKLLEEAAQEEAEREPVSPKTQRPATKSKAEATAAVKSLGEAEEAGETEESTEAEAAAEEATATEEAATEEAEAEETEEAAAEDEEASEEAAEEAEADE